MLFFVSAIMVRGGFYVVYLISIAVGKIELHEVRKNILVIAPIIKRTRLTQPILVSVSAGSSSGAVNTSSVRLQLPLVVRGRRGCHCCPGDLWQMGEAIDCHNPRNNFVRLFSRRRKTSSPRALHPPFTTFASCVLCGIRERARHSDSAIATLTYFR